MAHRVGQIKLQGMGEPLPADTPADMDRHTDAYVSSVLSFAGDLPVWVEYEITTQWGSRGFVDCWFISNRTLYVFDFKYGRVPVNAFRNGQFIIYADGLMRRVNPSEYDRIRMCVFQPRAYHPGGSLRTWTVAPSEIPGLMAPIVRSAEIATQPNPPTQSGPHCRDCRARHVCHTASTVTAHSIEVSGHALEYGAEPAELSIRLAEIKRAKDHLTAMESAMESHIFGLMKTGAHVPGLSVEFGRGSTSWKNDGKGIKELGDVEGVQLVKDKLLTPKQAGEAGLNAQLITHLTEHKPGKKKLKIDDGLEALRIFGRKGE